MFVVRMTNGRGHSEFYQSLSVRRQAACRERAQQFSATEEAAEAASDCQKMASCFSDVYFDRAADKWTLTATVEPADAQ